MKVPLNHVSRKFTWPIFVAFELTWKLHVNDLDKRSKSKFFWLLALASLPLVLVSVIQQKLHTHLTKFYTHLDLIHFI